MEYFERSKKAWERASEFSSTKEEVYPDHKIVQEFDAIRDKDVYEYGCGGGSDVISYLRRGNRVTATDIVPKNLEVTSERIKKSGLLDPVVKLVLLDNSYPLPFPDESFDVISSHGVLHHIIDIKPVMKELFRVCRKNGYLYIMLYTDIMERYFIDNGMIDNFMSKYGIDFNEAFGYCTDGPGTPYSRSYNTIQACDLMEEAGFLVVDFNYWLKDHFCTYKAIKEG